MNEQDPYQSRFIIKWKNKLDIGDMHLHFLKDPRSGLKEMILSFKMIFINTYNVIVFDVSTDENSVIAYRHESFQLWESEICGLLLSGTNDFLILNKDGMNVIALGSTNKRTVVDNMKQVRMLHSLDSFTYLKIDPGNYIVFECAKMDKRVISIQ